LKEWRQNLISESAWMENQAYGPDDQPYPESTSLEDEANKIITNMDNRYPGSAAKAAAVLRVPDQLEDNLYGLGLDDEIAEALDEALEGLDVQGDGNFDGAACCKAIFDAVHARSGSHFIED